MLTSAEVCDHLRITEKTLRRMINDGEIRASKIGRGRWGGRYRINEEDLADYIKQQEIVPGAAAS
jgi:excisionase family DNA binding protein